MFKFKKKRRLNEMAKASEGRMLDRLPDTRKAIYLTGKALEKLGDSARLTPYKTFITGNGMDWSVYKESMDEINMGLPTENTTWTASRNSFASNFHDRFDRLYNNMKRMIEVSKDDIDRNYVDKIKTYYNKVRNEHIDPADAFEQTELQSAIDWIKDDPEEAEERFGTFWPIVKRHLSRWLDADYENSLSNLMDKFWDWRRANQRNTENQTPLDNELAIALANKLVTNREDFSHYYNFVLATVIGTLGVANLPHALASKMAHDYVDNSEEDARAIYGNMYARIKKVVQEIFEIDTESDALPTAEELARFDATANGTAEAAPAEDTRNGYDRYVADSETIPVELKETIKTLIDGGRYNNDEIWNGNIGAVDRDQVRKMYAEARQINIAHHRGRHVAFNLTTLQEFYDLLKPIFLAGFTTEFLKDAFINYALKVMEMLDHEDEDYWANQPEDTQEEFTESMRTRRTLRMMFENRHAIDPEEMYLEDEILPGGNVAYDLSELIGNDGFIIDHNYYEENGNFTVTVSSDKYPDYAQLLITGNKQTIESACLHQIVDDDDKEIDVEFNNVKDLALIASDYVGVDITDIDQI